MSVSAPAPILVVGWSQVGKTVLAAQLLLRLRDAAGGLRLRTPPKDVSLLESAIADLSQGLAPKHTPKDALGDLTLHLEGPVDLIWPDYGGEQIRRMTRDTRQLPSGWRPLIERAGGWLLLVRPSGSPDYTDVVSRPLHSVMREWRGRSSAAGEDSDEGITVDWSDQALLVETLQILMEVREIRPYDSGELPALVVALTCWDELFPDTDETVAPPALLAERYPLLHAFIESNWPPAHRAVFGLSAQGQRLNQSVPDEEYAIEGPEGNGYIVHPSGERDPDLTGLIAGLLSRMEP